MDFALQLNLEFHSILATILCKVERRGAQHIEMINRRIQRDSCRNSRAIAIVSDTNGSQLNGKDYAGAGRP